MGYADHRERAGEAQRQKSRAYRDIGELPDVKEPARRGACERDLLRFLSTYMSATFYLPWSRDHIDVGTDVQRAILEGGQDTVAMPRGSGKTSFLEGASIWAILYDHRHFLVTIGANGPLSEAILQSIGNELENNERLHEDFPEVCYPIRRLEGITQRRLLWDGELIEVDPRIHLVLVGRHDLVQQVLADAAPAGDRAVDTAWWKLRMEALRLMHRPDEFELAALDYCVTYEVSPPSWDIPRCHYRAVQAEAQEGGSTLTASTHEGGWAESQGPSTLTAASTRPGASGAPAELAGTVLGDASALLEHIDHRLVDMDSLVISCARLVRMDFAAAGTLLNWATARHAEGRAIHLVDVNRLVAEFFHVIGISAQARISLRRD